MSTLGVETEKGRSYPDFFQQAWVAGPQDPRSPSIHQLYSVAITVYRIPSQTDKREDLLAYRFQDALENRPSEVFILKRSSGLRFKGRSKFVDLPEKPWPSWSDRPPTLQEAETYRKKMEIYNRDSTKAFIHFIESLNL